MQKSRRRKRRVGLISRRHERPGTAPGSLHSAGYVDEVRAALSLFRYSQQELEALNPDELPPPQVEGRVQWLNIDGLRDLSLLRKLQNDWGFHPLALEDATHTSQRPKVDVYPQHLFMTLRMIMLSPGGEVSSEQVALFLGDGVLVSIQEKPGDCFAPVRERLRLSNGRIRGRGPDYMLYALVDAIIDHYFPVLEALADRLEILEEEVLARPRRELVGQIHLARRELLMLRRAVWPLREAVGRLLQEQTPRIEDDTRLFLRDCYDHVVQLLDMTETMREICSSLLETYMSSVSLRMNETMQVLTVIATIFIPLTFISGLYGMNFDHEISPWNMPELHWRWGYPAVLLLMGLVAVGLLIYFRRIGWLGERASRSVAPDELLETTEV